MRTKTFKNIKKKKLKGIFWEDEQHMGWGGGEGRGGGRQGGGGGGRAPCDDDGGGGEHEGGHHGGHPAAVGPHGKKKIEEFKIV